MGLRWAYTRPDGGIDIVQAMRKEDLLPVIGKPDEFGRKSLSDQDYKAFVLSRSIPADATNVVELPEDWVEPPKTYRNAWVMADGKIAVDPGRKAKLLIPRIKEEAQRRIIALTGQTGLISSMVKQSNANMRATELNDKRISGTQLTADEATEAVALRGLAAAIKAIRAKSNELEKNPPDDFEDDKYWQV